MEFKYDVSGAPVVYTEIRPKPYNPLIRPAINYKKPLICLFVYLLITGIGSCAFFHWFEWKFVFFLVSWTVLYTVFIAKKAIIWIIHFYQAKAPDRIRLKCVYEPSCSVYMILAIEKYGVVKGVVKGIKRLRRCGFPNGGIDYP